MIPIAVDDVLQATVEGTNERTPWAWVTHWRVTAVADPTDHVNELANHLRTFLNAIDADLTTEWQAECIKISRVAPGPMGVWYDSTGMPIVGDVATDGIPSTAAAVVRFSTAEAGASNRGRMYLTGIPEASTNGGQLTGAARTSLEGSFPGLIAGYASGGESGTMVIFSRALYGTDPPGHPADTDDYTAVVTDFDVLANLGTIRNRRYPRNNVA